MKPMNPVAAAFRRNPGTRLPRAGFSLISVILMMVLLATLALGLLSLSTISMRGGAQEEAKSRARANAKLALMLAIGQLQRDAGPDRRVTADAAVLDRNPSTPGMDEVAHPHWCGVWDSWGTWLNATYDRDGKPPLGIGETYDAGRTQMFRSWLVSGDDMDRIDAVRDEEPFGPHGSVRLVGPSPDETDPGTRAGLVPVGGTSKSSGGLAWWVDGENLKADVSLNAPPAKGSDGEMEAAHGGAGSRRLSEIDGMDGLSRDPEIVAKYLSRSQVILGGADAEKVREHFHDLTAWSAGLLTDTRWGGLRKDLSLLFENPSLPRDLARNGSFAPGARPMSSDLSAFGPKIPERPFTGFEQMANFARQYKSVSPAAGVNWTGSSPAAASTNTAASMNAGEADYRRMPVIVKSYCIFNLQTEPTNAQPPASSYRYYLTYSPVLQLWNPYNVPLELESGALDLCVLPYKIINIEGRRTTNAGPQGAWTNMWSLGMRENSFTALRSANGGKIRFKPGQFLVFSFKNLYGSSLSGTSMTPGFDPAAVGSVKIEIPFNPVVGPGDRPGLALRIRPVVFGAGDIVYYYGGNPGSFSQQLSWQNYSGVTMDWFGDAAGDNTVFAPESGSNRALWQFSDREPVPVAAFGVTLKTSEAARYDLTQDDWRDRTWVQSAPGLGAEQLNAVYGNPQALARQRLNASLQVHWRTLNGVAELGELVPHLGDSGFMGSGSTAGEKIAAAPVLEIPTAPVQSLAGFSGMRLQPGWFNYGAREIPVTAPCAVTNIDANYGWQQKIGAYRSGVPGVGIGNSFACPMIPADKPYAFHDISKINPLSHEPPAVVPQGRTDSHAFSDYWDHGLLVNDGLWDSWFVSSLSDAHRPTDTGAPSLPTLLAKTFEDGEPLPNANFTPLPGGEPSTIAADLVKPDGYLRAARHLMNRGAFNVNSTSEDAWFALFSSLRDHPVMFRDAGGALHRVDPPQGMAVVSRFNTETAGEEVSDPRGGVAVDGLPSWSGVRFLSEQQLRNLARECVVQVKKRGPFLNLSDFINRRLAGDDTGTRGALQAAIDYDDEAPDDSSINYRYKSGPNDRIAASDYDYAAYPFPEAAKGSRFTGAPGYVIQSDLLRPLGNALTPRDDTFRIRAYGDAKDVNGKIVARAWCEAVVQRLPAYVDPANAPEVPATLLNASGDPAPNPELSDLNRCFGRTFALVSVRWLNPDEL